MSRLREWPRPLQLLLGLAVFEYLSKGLVLAAFSNGFDFAAYYDAAVMTVHGDGARIYDSFFAYRPGTYPVPMYFLYPAPVAALFAPFGLLSFHGAFALFQVLCHACLWATLALWCRRRPPEKRAEAFVLLFLFFPVYYALQIGQAEPVILLALAGGLVLEEEGVSHFAGACFALAIALKLFLLLLLPFFVLRRAWRAAAWTAAWLCALAALGGLVVPWEVQAEYWRRVGAPLGIEAFTDNQSLAGFVARTFGDTRYASGLVDAPSLGRAFKALLGAGLLAGWAWLVARAREKAAFGRAAGFTVVTAILLAPIGDTHHFALLLPGFLALLEGESRPAWALVLYAFFARFEPLVAYKFVSPERLAFWSRAPQDLLHSLPFLALLVLWGLSAHDLAARRPTAR